MTCRPIRVRRRTSRKAQPETLEKLVAAYDAWEADVDRAGFDPIPTELGHGEMPTVKLPAHEAILHPEDNGQRIRYHGAPGWANDWITGWTDPASHADWRVKVVEPGEYRVEIDYACDEANVGATVELELAGEKVRFTAEEPFKSTRIPAQDRIIQGERHNYACTWKRARIGTISLPKTGETDLVLRGVKKTGDALIRCEKRDSYPAAREEASEERAVEAEYRSGDGGRPGLGGRRLQRPFHIADTRIWIAWPPPDCGSTASTPAAPVCSPTRGSVMTGRHPNRFGCFSWGYSLKPEEVTVAEALRQAGYTTGHFGKWHLGSVQKGSPVNPGCQRLRRVVFRPQFLRETIPFSAAAARRCRRRGRVRWSRRMRRSISSARPLKRTGRSSPSSGSEPRISRTKRFRTTWPFMRINRSVCENTWG